MQIRKPSRQMSFTLDLLSLKIHPACVEGALQNTHLAQVFAYESRMVKYFASSNPTYVDKSCTFEYPIFFGCL